MTAFLDISLITDPKKCNAYSSKNRMCFFMIQHGLTIYCVQYKNQICWSLTYPILVLNRIVFKKVSILSVRMNMVNNKTTLSIISYAVKVSSD